MNTPRRESKRTVKDTTLMGSAFNPEWVDRVSKLTEPQYGHEPVRGITDAHTEILRRVAAASETPAMSWDEKGQYWQKVKEAEAKSEEAFQKSMAKMWKSKEQRLEDLQGQLEEDLSY